MNSGDWLADFALRVISSPAVRQYVTNSLYGSDTPSRAHTGTERKSKMPTMRREKLEAAKGVVTAFAAFLESRMGELDKNLPHEAQLMRDPDVQEYLDELFNLMCEKDEWDLEDGTRIASIAFWMTVGVTPAPETKKESVTTDG